jgi:exopolysaccharide biosynthesis protein
VVEGFTAYQQGEKIRDAIGNDSLNARSAVGITQDGDVILAMVAQLSEQPLNSGISIPQLGAIMADLGAVKAMNLDGGSSASLYYDSQAIYGRVDKEGKEIIRPIKSVLSVIQP